MSATQELVIPQVEIVPRLPSKMVLHVTTLHLALQTEPVPLEFVRDHRSFAKAMFVTRDSVTNKRAAFRTKLWMEFLASPPIIVPQMEFVIQETAMESLLIAHLMEINVTTDYATKQVAVCRFKNWTTQPVMITIRAQ